MFRRIFLAGAVSLPLLTINSIASGDEMTGLQLLQAAQGNDAVLLKQLLAAGAHVDHRDSNGATALLVATHANAIDAARVLIEAGADVNAKDSIHDSPYLYAGARGHLEILKLTLTHGADLKSTNRYGGTALIPAAERGHVATVKALIEAGVDVDHVNNLHWTALHEAIVLGDGGPRHQEIVKLLIQAGANVNLPDGGGVTPLQLARNGGYEEIEHMLSVAGAK